MSSDWGRTGNWGYGCRYLYTIFIPIPFLSYFSVHFITFELWIHDVNIFDIFVAIANSGIPPVSSLPSGGSHFGERSSGHFPTVGLKARAGPGKLKWVFSFKKITWYDWSKFILIYGHYVWPSSEPYFETCSPLCHFCLHNRFSSYSLISFMITENGRC